MRKRSAEKCCAEKPVDDTRVEAIISIDERGQMVLPKEIRTRAGLGPGDKLAVVTKEKEGKVCCIYLFKTEEVSKAIKDRLGPLLLDLQRD